MALKRVQRLLSPVSFDTANVLRLSYTRILAANQQLRTYVVKTPVYKQDSNFRGMPASFPCLDRLKEKSESLTGLKGMYGEDVGGFKLMEYDQPFRFKHGGVVPEMHIAYEEWGTRNEDRSNVVLLFTGLSASSHAKSHNVWSFSLSKGACKDAQRYRSPFLIVGQYKSRVVGRVHWPWRTYGYQQIQYYLLQYHRWLLRIQVSVCGNLHRIPQVDVIPTCLGLCCQWSFLGQPCHWKGN